MSPLPGHGAELEDDALSPVLVGPVPAQRGEIAEHPPHRDAALGCHRALHLPPLQGAADPELWKVSADEAVEVHTMLTARGA